MSPVALLVSRSGSTFTPRIGVNRQGAMSIPLLPPFRILLSEDHDRASATISVYYAAADVFVLGVRFCWAREIHAAHRSTNTTDCEFHASRRNSCQSFAGRRS